ncbi:MAG: HPr family phosphocarrier protein [bacterium]
MKNSGSSRDRPEESGSEVEEKELSIMNRLGLHARAAGHFRKKAAEFDSHIEVEKGHVTCDGKSLLGLMALEASQGTTIKVRAEGQDAKQAVDALEELVNDRFGEEE